MDTTLCKGEKCPIKEKCKRFNSEPGKMQSYFVNIPGYWEWRSPKNEEFSDNKVWKCDMFWGEQQDSIMDVLTKATGGTV